MQNFDPRVDAYIARSAEFARPILAHLRAIVHEACPNATETIKWGMPFFLYEGILCHMASFKHHCAFGFWKAPGTPADDKRDEAMGQFGRIERLADLPPKRTMIGYVKKVVALKSTAAPAPKRAAKKSTALAIPPALEAALARNRKARASFDAFSPSQRRDYAEWIAEAKREETRDRRVATAIEDIAAGRPRHWQYATPRT